eukprot:4677867-Pyramimonas_sp.AAC.1
MSRRRGRLAALPPLPAGEEWCADLPCGARARVSYDGDIMDHERVVVWPSRRVEDGELLDPH